MDGLIDGWNVFFFLIYDRWMEKWVDRCMHDRMGVFSLSLL